MGTGVEGVVEERRELIRCRLGLEGLITFNSDKHAYDAENYVLTLPTGPGPSETVTVGVFDRVRVEVGIEKDKNTKRGKVVMRLVEPVDSASL